MERMISSKLEACGKSWIVGWKLGKKIGKNQL